MLGRERQGEDVVVGEQPAHVLGELAGLVDLRGAGGDAVVGQHADRVAEHLLVFRESERARGAARGGHRLHRTARFGDRGDVGHPVTERTVE